jgi:hypothetical protein
MLQLLDQSVQNAYSDLLSSSLTPAFDGTGLSFTRKVIKNRTYLYVSVKVGNMPMQRYLGPDNEETQALIEKEKAVLRCFKWVSQSLILPQANRIL